MVRPRTSFLSRSISSKSARRERENENFRRFSTKAVSRPRNWSTSRFASSNKQQKCVINASDYCSFGQNLIQCNGESSLSAHWLTVWQIKLANSAGELSHFSGRYW